MPSKRGLHTAATAPGVIISMAMLASVRQILYSQVPMATNDQKFEEHIRTRKETPPRILYKYVTADTATKILRNRTLRFQSPLRYNDPFDSQWDPLWPLSTPKAMDYQRALAERALRDPASWPDDANLEWRRQWDCKRANIESLPEEQREEAIGRFVDNLKKMKELKERIEDIIYRMRFLCLCECDRSILMWSHYADQHKGIVLGFDVSELEDQLRVPFMRVKYCDELPCLIDSEACKRAEVFGLPCPPIENTYKWVLAKHTDWYYEKEWRLVCKADANTNGQHEDIAFPAKALVEIASGCRAERLDSSSSKLLDLARNIQPKVRHYSMSPHPSRFALVKKQSDIL
jgi:hypothetical protein